MHPNDLAQVDAYLTHLAAIGRPRTTITTRRTPLLRVTAELPHGLLSETEELEAWLGGQELAKNTRASYTSSLRDFYRWCRRTGRISADPAADLAPARQQRGNPRPVPDPQLSALLRHAQEPYRLWMLVAAYAGLRCCELSRLRREDIDAQILYVDEGKGGASRVVPTHTAVWAAVRDLPPGLICGGITPKRVSANINTECDRLAERLGWPELADVVAHRLRHTCLTAVYAGSRDLRATQQIAGHRSPATTAIYTLVSDEALRAAMATVPAPATAAAA